MKITITYKISCESERLCRNCKEAPRKPVRVRGHFRVVNGRKVYVRSHLRMK